ncbi:hypothetical protein SCUCBS95973_001338 [Sporothrix curviconia]|uniref:Uncharacterized protein n=1 Tax=Sporothrix curviconia TaxID=1260050 RepID=A0ABP0AY51_9PEZI
MTGITGEGGGARVDAGTNGDKVTKPKLSTRDQEILMASWLCIKGADPQVDYEKLAKILHLKNAHTASTVFSNVKKKVKAFQSSFQDSSDGADALQSSPAVPKAKASRKRASTTALEPSTPGNGVKRIKTEPELPTEEDNYGSV